MTSSCSSPVGHRDCQMIYARRSLPGLGFASSASAEYQPLDMGIGLLPSEDTPAMRWGCCWWPPITQGRCFNGLVALVLCANALLIGLETDLGLLGDGTPNWMGLQADAGILGAGTGEQALEGELREGLRADTLLKEGLEEKVNQRFHRDVDFEGDLRLETGTSALKSGAYTAAEFVFVAFFTLEFLLRLCDSGCSGCSGFCGDPWSKFDFGLVLLGWADLGFPFLLLSGDEASSTALLLLSVLRLSRAFRVLRLFRVLPELRAMARGCASAFTTVLWVGAVLLILNFLLATLLTSLVGQNAHHWGDRAEEVRTWFGSIGRTMETLFSIMTLSGWDDVASVMTAVIPPTVVGLFILVYIMLCFFAMLSLLTGMVHATLAGSEKRQEIHRLNEVEDLRASFADALTSLFSSTDLTKSGWLSRPEFKAALEGHPAVLSQLLKMDVETNTEELLMLFDRLSHDSGSGGSVEIFSLVEAIVLTNGTARSSEVFDVKYLVRALRRDLGGQMDSLKREIASYQHHVAADTAQLAAEVAAQRAGEGPRHGDVAEVAAAVAGLERGLGEARAAVAGVAGEVISMGVKLEGWSRQRELDKAAETTNGQALHTKLDALSMQVFANAALGGQLEALAAQLAAPQRSLQDQGEELARLVSVRLSSELAASLASLRPAPPGSGADGGAAAPPEEKPA
eukprot:CAMPEP_0203839598 /NCGR_PEP_ID=MMETSP0359-20131031/267_1 /ASSEMBLY_ACC=CAM_ASM_000338 /TAXON_ID=268821 /ORGANISM="Scrippsiella Hangoei, Strain SHTV-5" /LENGTH=683 /DNA_ID=CAMNT_0050753661 /DNA_START=84 /DNA_END=2132 /DNA_ORIENTATION=-